MDTINQYPLDSGFPEGDQRSVYTSDRPGSFDDPGNGDGWKLVDVILSGRAPWGFTIRGGLEHGGPLLITKVDEGGKAAVARLQAGDELVKINNFPLTGYRQEAICLVKGSHKSLSLVVKRNMKMVDFVAQKMPSESDVHMARSFLTKILRSSMRRNEPMSRPHSWHATKCNENHSEVKTQSTPSPVWQTRYDASSFSSDLSTGWEQTNLRRVSDQFSSLGSMDSLEQSSHPYPPGRLSPSKSNNNSIEHLGGGKRDSAYSSFSTSSGTPDYTLSKSNAASTENMLYKINQWDSSGRHSNGRHSQSLSHDEKLGYVQLPSGPANHEIPRIEEQPGTRNSSSGRIVIGPVWNVPDIKKNVVSSTPPPTPPTRSDSFAATKVHERSLITGTSELKPLVKGLQKTSETHERSLETCLEGRRDYNLPFKNNSSNSSISSDTHHQYVHRMASDKPYSLSTTDVRERHPTHANIPYHPRQYSDEVTFHAQTRTVPAPKPPFSGYYSSMQELPTNNHTQLNSQNQVRRPAASLSGLAMDPEGSTQSRYYGVTSHQTPQGMSQASLVRIDDSKASLVSELSHGGRDRISVGSQGGIKDRYYPPQPQHHDPDYNAFSKKTDNHLISASTNPLNMSDSTTTKPSEVRVNQKQHHVSCSDTHFGSHPPSKQPEQRRSVGLPKDYSQQPLPTKGDSKICPQKTPMLYSLAQEHNDVDDYQKEMNSVSAQQEAFDESKQARRSDRFATTLRNEIQMRRAQLQKSQSAATLGSPDEAAEETACWKSSGKSSPSSSGTFSSSYKDHLKEAQARVLQATSFRRKDLEPVLFEHPSVDVASREDVPPVSEVPSGKPTSGSSQVFRIGGRKRFSAEQKVRSVSEPDKIHEVGAEEHSPASDNAAHLENRRKFFEPTAKPAFPKPMPKHNLQTCEDTRVSKPGGMPHPAKSDMGGRSNTESSTPIAHNLIEGQDGSRTVNQLAMLKQQRLGTFAEYEAKWNGQKKTTEPRQSGRYHSADNILDTGIEEQRKPTCMHERSRSSPSADFYGQKLPLQERKSDVDSKPERNLSNQDMNGIRLNAKEHSELVCKAKPEPPALTKDLEIKSSDPPPGHHKPAPPFSDVSPRSEPSALSINKSSVLLPHLEKYTCPEGTPPPLGKFQEVQPGSQGGVLASLSPVNSQCSTPSQVPRKSLEHSKGPVREEELQQELVPPPFPPPPPPVAPPTQQSTGPTQPTMEGQRSPSPQFAPQRLTDKPPVSVSIQDEAPGRMDRVKDETTSVKKVPIKIVHSESNTEKESRQYLDLHSENPLTSQTPGVTHLQSLGNPDQSYSLFCTYTRQKDQGPESRDVAMGPLKDQGLQTNVNPVPHAIHGQQIDPSVDHNSNGVSSHTSHSEDDDGKREELARDIMGKDKTLVDILDQSKMKTTMDLMEGIFPQEEQLLEEAQQRRKAAPKQLSHRNSVEKKEDETLVAATALVTNSTYYSTSVPKAELLIKMKDMQEQSVEHVSEDELEEDNENLSGKKHELIDSLSKKLQVLREAQESLQEDVQDNNALGEEVEGVVQGVCKPNELDKFRMFVGDLDKVVNLLLSLSGRLARVENALNSLEEDASLEERRTLTEKRKLLIRQHEDAKELKENLDRRERVVYEILASYLSEERMADYEHFVKMKSALIIEQRKLEDKIKLGEEQLKCLMDSLPIDQRIMN
ncbi:protein Shroom2 isoform X3 [Triplophysa rosa]|uniref:protein Shroom2 isoform X3 n=2 Tax=Triplophysa rosa TaxID=992332 RepID=UPI002545FC55|nr:protein Shroom2 isoform X3 [Triplophysa rosa]